MSPQKRAAAGVIRASLWRGVQPPSPDRRPWSMGRELHAWQQLVDGGANPEDLNKALGVLRQVEPRARRTTALFRPGLLADFLQAVRESSPRSRAGAERQPLQLGLIMGALAPSLPLPSGGPAGGRP